MSNNSGKYKLVIVESPSKGKNIEKYLSGQPGPFKVIASKGHIKDLPKKDFGIDLNNFDLTIVPIEGKESTIEEIIRIAKDASEVYLASDPDREGEAIAFHLREVIKRKDAKRVLFNEVTKPAIIKAIQNPLSLDDKKYEAQKTRRALDRIVGYKISPVLWNKLQKGLSAGRVQSVALRIIVEREDEITNFVPEQWFQIIAKLHKDNINFDSKYYGLSGDKKKDIESKEEADSIVRDIKDKDFVVFDVQTKEKKQNPSAPFTTSKLQQDAANKLGFDAKKTMQIAQKLYEGVSLTGHGPQGLITYMRTDSVRTEPQSIDAVREYIEQKYGPTYLPAEKVIYKKKGEGNVQDAHEAIRPVSLKFSPDSIRGDLDKDEYKLYSLIWNKFVSSQMNPAILDQTTITFKADKYFFKSSGSVVKFDGFRAIYSETKEEKKSKKGGEDESNNEQDLSLPKMELNESLRPVSPPEVQEKFTSAPPRFHEGGLIKELEEKGIGRPATYAAIIQNIIDRQYVAKNKDGRFYPTDLGFKLCRMLVSNFPKQVDVTFTAQMESDLDDIESGSVDWRVLLAKFWNDLQGTISHVSKTLPDIPREAFQIRPEDKTGIICERCHQGEYLVKKGKEGEFLACSKYPECKSTKNFKRNKKGGIEILVPKLHFHEGVKCPTCAKKMVVIKGKNGKFLACEDQACKTTRPIPLEFTCSACKEGKLVKRKSQAGKEFYSCFNAPKCPQVYWNKPVKQECSQCKHEWMEEIEYKDKNSKEWKKFVACPVCKKKEARKEPPKKEKTKN